MGEILILDEAAVEELLDAQGCVEAMREALRALALGTVHLPLRPIVRPPGVEAPLILMPVYRSAEPPLYGLKSIVFVPDNPTRGLDPHQGTVSLFDGVTGQTLAIVNASPITAVRTAACSAVATEALARPDARALAVVGTGHQAAAHLRVMPAVRAYERVVVAGREPERTSRFAAEHGAEPAASVEEAVRGADVVVTATSSSTPVLRREWLAPGTHVNAVGACFPDIRELDSETVAASAYFVDRRQSAENEAGDYLLALEDGAIEAGHIRAELGDVLIGADQGRRSPEELTVFESLGVAVEDLYAAEYLLRKARDRGLGTIASL